MYVVFVISSLIFRRLSTRLFLSHQRCESSSSEVSFFKRIFGQTTNNKQTDQELVSVNNGTISEIESEERIRRILRLRNKSRLSASDERVLNDQCPYRGVLYELTDFDASVENKRALCGRYGCVSTGINPSIAWPSADDIALQMEYERVLYDGLSLQQIIENNKEIQAAKLRDIIDREKKIDENLIKMEEDLNRWRSRIEIRNATAEREKAKRSKILAELRKEFGYDVDPSQPQFAAKITEKEKAMAKVEREEKKRLRNTQNNVFTTV